MSITDLDAYLVTTKLAKIRRSSLLIPTEDAFVKGALHNIGRDGAPYWSPAYPPPSTCIFTLIDDRIDEWVLGNLPVLVGGCDGSVVAGINKRMHEDIRRRALTFVEEEVDSCLNPSTCNMTDLKGWLKTH